MSVFKLKDALIDIENEMTSAIEKHGEHRTPLNPHMGLGHKLTILVEEVGEVARAMTYDEGSPEKLYKELIQVATMAASWAQSMYKGGENGTDGFTSDSND